ncbi:hypothetical protein FACS1894102_3940 [Spirochaetia bacterium]|nr:hypothetical protein FACS1894102_3940 [Spirochaetia bacterium]
MSVQKGDIIQTEDGTTLVLELLDSGVKFDISDHTTIKILHLALDGNIHSINLIYGRLLVTNLNGGQIIYIEAGSSAAEFYTGVLSADFRIMPNSTNIHSPTLTLAAIEGSAILVPDIQNPDMWRVDIDQKQMAIVGTEKTKIEAFPMDKRIPDYWVYHTKTILHYGPTSPPDAAKFDETLTEEQRLRLRLIGRTGLNDAATLDSKTTWMIVGLSLVFAGAAMQGAGYFTRDSLPIADTLFMAGYAPLGLGCITLLIDIIHKPKKRPQF